MTPRPTSLSINDLMQRDPEFILNWMREAKSIDQEEVSNFNWLGLAQAAATKAWSYLRREQCSQKLSLQWANISLVAYDRMIDNVPHPENDSFVQYAMNLRVGMMQGWGVQLGHSVLDPHLVANGFLGSLNQSVEEVRALAKPWLQPGIFKDQQFVAENIEVLKFLKPLKSQLGIIERLLQIQGGWQPPQDLWEWVNLRSELP